MDGEAKRRRTILTTTHTGQKGDAFNSWHVMIVRWDVIIHNFKKVS